MGRLPVLDMQRRIPACPVGTGGGREGRAAEVVEGKVELLGGKLARHAEDAVVRDERLELAPERVALDPVHHVAAVAGPQRNGAAGVDVRHVLLDVCESVDEVFVGESAPLLPDGVGEGLSVAGGSGGVGTDGDVALLGEDGWIPACAPAVRPCALWAAMYEVSKRVFFTFGVA